MSLIFFNIAWMPHYQGEKKWHGNFGYLQKDENVPFESWNFFPFENNCYGYVPIREELKIHLENINKKYRNDDKIDNITIVFFAKNPENNISYIVGWYKNATLYRNRQKGPFKINNSTIYYAARTSEENAFCIPISARTFDIPSAHAGRGFGYGQTPIWYANNNENAQQFARKVEEYINNFRIEDTPDAIYINNIKRDIEYNKNIEDKAINTTMTYYKNNGYTVTSVEKDNLGYDLKVEKNNQIMYYVEVKGNACQQAKIRLTPNEYSCLKNDIYKDNYIIASVTECNTDYPNLTLYKIIKEKNYYYIMDIENNKRKFKITEIISAFVAPE